MSKNCLTLIGFALQSHLPSSMARISSRITEMEKQANCNPQNVYFMHSGKIIEYLRYNSLKKKENCLKDRGSTQSPGIY